MLTEGVGTGRVEPGLIGQPVKLSELLNRVFALGQQPGLMAAGRCGQNGLTLASTIRRLADLA